MNGEHSKRDDGTIAAGPEVSGESRDLIAEGRAADRTAAEAGRREAADAGEAWAEPVDLGVSIDPSAPLPHLIADGERAVLLFHAGLDPDPTWDGRTVTVIDPAGAAVRRLSWIIFEGVAQVSLGRPNDESLEGHPLYAAGLRHCQAHEVHNSDLIAEMERRTRLHRHHRPEMFWSLWHFSDGVTFSMRAPNPSRLLEIRSVPMSYTHAEEE